jgi:hypothetical protein
MISPMGAALDRVATFWEDAHADFVAHGCRWSGLPPALEALKRWRRAYDGLGRGTVDEEAMPEPYLGDLDADVAMVVLALNPGRSERSFQGRDGRFIHEIRTLGSYRAWAASWPYLTGSWLQVNGRNRHHELRLAFMRRWFENDRLPREAMLSFELFPWHSHAKTTPIVPSPALVREFVWDPIAELQGRHVVFAFGADWFPVLAEGLGLEVVERLGAGGRDYGSRVASRAVLVCRTPNGTMVVALKHRGSAGPPAGDEVECLRDALHRYV